MALSSEDKADVKGAMGKAIANKVAKATRDKDSASRKYGGMLSTGEYLPPNTKKFAKEQRMFDRGKREINRLKRAGK